MHTQVSGTYDRLESNILKYKKVLLYIDSADMQTILHDRLSIQMKSNKNFISQKLYVNRSESHDLEQGRSMGDNSIYAYIISASSWSTNKEAKHLLTNE